MVGSSILNQPRKSEKSYTVFRLSFNNKGTREPGTTEQLLLVALKAREKQR